MSNFIKQYEELKNSGKTKRNYNCWYYFGQEDSRLWWNKSYPKALYIKKQLALNLINTLLGAHYLERDSSRINRILKAIEDIDKMLKDNPRLPFYKLWFYQIQYNYIRPKMEFLNMVLKTYIYSTYIKGNKNGK
jgi:hypothetical protein